MSHCPPESRRQTGPDAQKADGLQSLSFPRGSSIILVIHPICLFCRNIISCLFFCFRQEKKLCAFTSYDFTAFFQTVAPNHLSTVMDIEADRMKNLELTERDIQAERDVVLEERRSRTDK